MLFAGMGNYRVSISRRPPIDMVKNKSTNGVGVTTFLPQMARVWKCVRRELLLILKTKYDHCSFAHVSLYLTASRAIVGDQGSSREILSSDCLSFALQIVPQLQSGKNVMIAAHGNSLRSIIMYLDKLTSQEVIYHFITLGRPLYTPYLTL